MSVSSAQNEVARIQRDIQALNRKLADRMKEEAAKTSRIASITKTITKSTSPSSIQSKQQEVQRLQNEIARIQDQKASISKDIASRTTHLHKAQQKLTDEQQREQRRSLDALARDNRLRDSKLIGQLHNQIDSTESENVKMTYDAFISHATEDKEDVVSPLADALINMGHSIWYDNFQLTVGDSLRRSIDKGLADSRFGIVVLSPSFFSKQWPQYELDGLVAREIAGGKVIRPIWHKLSKDEVLRFSPTLADKVGLSTATYTIDELAAALSKVLKGT